MNATSTAPSEQRPRSFEQRYQSHLKHLVLKPLPSSRRGGYSPQPGCLSYRAGFITALLRLLRLQREAEVPAGGYLRALTAGEEDGDANGVQWLQAHRPDWLQAGYALNVDGGGPEFRGGKVAVMSMETAEKSI